MNTISKKEGHSSWYGCSILSPKSSDFPTRPQFVPLGLLHRSSDIFHQDCARNTNHQRCDGLRISCSERSPVCPSSIQQKWATCTPWSKFYLFATGILQMFLLLPRSNQELRFLNLLRWLAAEREVRFKVAGICIRMERAEPGGTNGAARG